MALSGGLDSTALLLGLHDLSPAGTLRAAHVHHGLHPDADAWAEHCRQLCERLQVPLEILHVSCAKRPGESQEEQARLARYQALGGILRPGEWLLTAHHRQDQAETLLLQLLRGAGLDGLAGMPPRQPFAAGFLARPLLDCERAAMQAFVEIQGVAWIEDPANASADFRRNRVRRQLIPFLQQLGWPAAVKTVARSAANLADAKAVVAETAAADWAACSDAQGRVRRDALRRLSPARQRYALRHGIQARHLPMPGRDALERLRLRLVGPDTGKTLEWAGGVLWLHGEHGQFLPADEAPAPVPAESRWRPAAGPLAAWQAMLLPAGSPPPSAPYHDLRADLFGQELRVAYRQGGEHYLTAQGHRRSLKQALQELGVPPRARARLPLLYDGEGRLLAVLGLFTCGPGLPRPGEERVMRMTRSVER